MSDTITRCPECKTSFKIHPAHLQSAKGTVRCGSCLNIFVARNHLVSKKPLAVIDKRSILKEELTTSLSAGHAYEQHNEFSADMNDQDNFSPKITDSAPAQTLKKPDEPSTNAQPSINPEDAHEAQHPPASDTNIPDDDDFLISDDLILDDDEELIGDTENRINTKDNNRAVNLFERTEKSENLDTEEKPSDESWALDLLENINDIESTPTPTPTKTDTLPLDTTKPSSKELEEEHSDEFQSNFFIIDDSEDVKDSNEVLSASVDEDATDNQETNEHQNDTASALIEADENSFIDPEEDYDHLEAQAVKAMEDIETHQDMVERAHPDYLDLIAPEPVDFSWQKKENFWAKNKLWLGLSVGCILIIALQAALYNAKRWSQIPQYHSYYTKTCQWLGCDVPPLKNRQLIRPGNLIVRSHPTVDNALIIDAVLQNNAKFTQPFPSLDLVFSNINDKTIAARRFKPKEYLGGELAGKSHMPIRQPIHIALEIADPGDDAVNYQLKIAD